MSINQRNQHQRNINNGVMANNGISVMAKIMSKAKMWHQRNNI
jgi:hypothetical protein